MGGPNSTNTKQANDRANFFWISTARLSSVSRASLSCVVAANMAPAQMAAGPALAAILAAPLAESTVGCVSAMESAGGCTVPAGTPEMTPLESTVSGTPVAPTGTEW